MPGHRSCGSAHADLKTNPISRFHPGAIEEVRHCDRVDLIYLAFSYLFNFIFLKNFMGFYEGKWASEIRNQWLFLCSFQYECQ